MHHVMYFGNRDYAERLTSMNKKTGSWLVSQFLFCLVLLKEKYHLEPMKQYSTKAWIKVQWKMKRHGSKIGAALLATDEINQWIKWWTSIIYEVFPSRSFCCILLIKLPAKMGTLKKQKKHYPIFSRKLLTQCKSYDTNDYHWKVARTTHMIHEARHQLRRTGKTPFHSDTDALLMNTETSAT